MYEVQMGQVFDMISSVSQQQSVDHLRLWSYTLSVVGADLQRV